QHGFTIVRRVLDATQQQTLLAFLGAVSGAGRRGLLASSAVSTLARSVQLLDLARPHMQAGPFPTPDVVCRYGMRMSESHSMRVDSGILSWQGAVLVNNTKGFV